MDEEYICQELLEWLKQPGGEGDFAHGRRHQQINISCSLHERLNLNLDFPAKGEIVALR